MSQQARQLSVPLDWTQAVAHPMFDHVAKCAIIKLTQELSHSHLHSKSLKISFHSNPFYTKLITTKFCTCHDSCAVMTCAKFGSNLMPKNWFKATWFCNEISILGTKSLVWQSPWNQWLINIITQIVVSYPKQLIRAAVAHIWRRLMPGMTSIGHAWLSNLSSYACIH